jgi:hypothetical protein
MSCKCCCDSKEVTIKRCPVCDNESLEVSKKTMESLLNKDRISKISDNQYYFCAEPDCEIVYFDGKDRFYKKDLKISIDDKVCFCFDISKDEIGKIGKEKVLEKIRDNMKEKGCNCETNNPSGRCCTTQIEKRY